MRKPPSSRRTVRRPDGAWQRIGSGVAVWALWRGIGLVAVALGAWGTAKVGALFVADSTSGVAFAAVTGFVGAVGVAAWVVVRVTRWPAELLVSTHGALLLGLDGVEVARAPWSSVRWVDSDEGSFLNVDGTPRRAHFYLDDSADWAALELAARIHGGTLRR